MLPFLVHKILTFYVTGVLNCKYPAAGPKTCNNIINHLCLDQASGLTPGVCNSSQNNRTTSMSAFDKNQINFVAPTPLLIVLKFEIHGMFYLKKANWATVPDMLYSNSANMDQHRADACGGDY